MSIRGVLLDLSGVLYVGTAPLPGAVEALRLLQESGLPVRYITNTTRSPRATIHRQLTDMGFAIAADHVYTAPRAVRAHLEREGLRPWLLIHPNLKPEFADLATDDPNAVVLGDAGCAFDYHHLNHAFRLLMDGAPLIAMGNNRFFMEDEGLSLDIGPFLAALEYAAGVEGLVLGKPSAAFFQAAVADMGCETREVVMIGDDALADVEGALKAGMQGWLVRTGKYRPGDEARIGVAGARVVVDFPSAVEALLRTQAPKA